jgi:hypothetical protein
MVQQTIAPIIPNLGNQEAAVAGSQAVTFTATDRKLIEERGGTVDKTRSFLSILKEKPLTPEVENEETNVQPEFNLQEFEGRVKEHKKMLRHSVIINPQERVEITNKLPDEYQPGEQLDLTPATLTSAATVQIEQPAAAAPVEQKAAAYDRLSAEQKSLNAVKSKVKRYQLERLFTDDEKEFKRLSEAIRQESLSTARPESKTWVEGQLNKVTTETAEYKLKLLSSLDILEHDTHHKKMIGWLTKTVEQLAKA